MFIWKLSLWLGGFLTQRHREYDNSPLDEPVFVPAPLPSIWN